MNLKLMALTMILFTQPSFATLCDFVNYKTNQKEGSLSIARVSNPTDFGDSYIFTLNDRLQFLDRYEKSVLIPQLTEDDTHLQSKSINGDETRYEFPVVRMESVEQSEHCDALEYLGSLSLYISKTKPPRGWFSVSCTSGGLVIIWSRLYALENCK